MSGFKIAKSQRRKAGQAPTEQGTTSQVEIMGPGMHNRLSKLGLPKNVIDLILLTSYQNTPATSKPLFAMAPSKITPGEWIYYHQEIQEIVIYYESLLQWGAPAPGQQEVITNLDDAYLNLKQHLDSLVWNRQMKTANDTLVADDSVFENPELSAIRTDEMLRNALLLRKKIPVPDLACKRCKIKEVIREEKYTRSGDEGGVDSYECLRCGHTWKKGG